MASKRKKSAANLADEARPHRERNKRARKASTEENEGPVFPFGDLVEDVQRLIVSDHMTLFDSIVFGQTCKKWHAISKVRFNAEALSDNEDILESSVGLKGEAALNGIKPPLNYCHYVLLGIGHVGSQKLLNYYFPNGEQGIDFYTYGSYPLYGAVISGHLDFFLSLIEVVPRADFPDFDFGDETGFVTPKGSTKFRPIPTSEIWLAAGINGDLGFIEDLAKEVPISPVALCKGAARNGHLPVLKSYLKAAKKKQKHDISSFFQLLYREAAHSGRISVLEYLLELFSVRPKTNDLISEYGVDPWDAEFLPLKGKIKPFLSFLEKIVDLNNTDLIESLVLRGDLECLEYLEERFRLTSKAFKSQDFTRPLCDVLYRGNYSYFKELFQRYKPEKFDTKVLLEDLLNPFDVRPVLKPIDSKDIKWLSLTSNFQTFELIEILKFLETLGISPPQDLLVRDALPGGGFQAPFGVPDMDQEHVSNYVATIAYLFQKGVSYDGDFILAIMERYGEEAVVPLRKYQPVQTSTPKPPSTRTRKQRGRK